ncbi:hypothetical protein HanPI659440_Chr10g0378141 [Helianthus annuus]|nr:hypothetical protein HanPI659440_Chr10g0378141 [Helianthus annuus]
MLEILSWSHLAFPPSAGCDNSHISNTDSSFSNQWRSPTAPSVPLNVLGRQSMKFLKVQTGC